MERFINFLIIRTWRTLQAICACHQICRWSTRYTEIPSTMMLRHMLRHCQSLSRCSMITATSQAQRTSLTQQHHRLYGVFESDESTEPEIPIYEALDLQMKGYDFVVLESFAKYVGALSRSFDLPYEYHEFPPHTSTISTYKQFSTIVEHSHNLSLYERVIRLVKVPSTTAQIFINVVHSNTPEGITVASKQLTAEEEEFRYVPDLMMNEIRTELDEMDRQKMIRQK